jgi:hypothetical protein
MRKSVVIRILKQLLKLRRVWRAIKVTGLLCPGLYRREPFERYLYAPSAMLRQADVAGRAPAYRRAKGHKASGVFLPGALRQCSAPCCGWYGQFAGILQGELRQQVSRGRMLMLGACEGTMRSRLARDPWHHQHAKHHRRLFLEHRRALRGACGGISQRLLGSPTPGARPCWHSHRGDLVCSPVS